MTPKEFCEKHDADPYWRRCGQKYSTMREWWDNATPAELEWMLTLPGVVPDSQFRTLYSRLRHMILVDVPLLPGTELAAAASGLQADTSDYDEAVFEASQEYLQAAFSKISEVIRKHCEPNFDASPDVNQWFPVSTPPGNNRDVVLQVPIQTTPYCRGFLADTGVWFGRGEGVHSFSVVQPTHWRELLPSEK